VSADHYNTVTERTRVPARAFTQRASTVACSWQEGFQLRRVLLKLKFITKERGVGRTGKEEEEILVVAVANAVVDPRAMVVHAENTLATAPTMVCPWRLGVPAFLAVACGSAFLLDLQLSPIIGQQER
jgi:hypothetical protein